jgi:hypothetical protein
MSATFKVGTTARKLKVTAVLDVASFAALGVVADNVPSRTDVSIAVGGRTVVADIATKAVRKAVKTIADNGADKVTLVLQGVMTKENRIEEAGLAATVKVEKVETVPIEAQLTV